MHKFDMKDLGFMRYFLGMEVYQYQEHIFICKIKYVRDMIT